jgi:hypothetical protein
LILALLIVALPETEWPDPGSEEPGGAKLFAKDKDEIEGDVKIPKAVAEPTLRWSWYGWRHLIGDGAALALGIAAVPTERFEVAIAGGIAFAIGGPIAHFTAGNWGRALISFAMRIGGPLLGGLAFVAVKAAVAADSDFDDASALALGIGGAVGALVAAGLDVGLLARDQVPVEPGP